jgi:NAD(P)-dependent dehydrogenase (short-subunit alcohol dehydrogenase family)
MSNQTSDLFRLDGKVIAITGGAGMLGVKYAEAIVEMGGKPILLDMNAGKLEIAISGLRDRLGVAVDGFEVDITNRDAVAEVSRRIIDQHGGVHGLINNAAMTVESNMADEGYFAPFEDYDVGLWRKALEVSLTGSFICSQVFGAHMKERGDGVILNIASDVGVISPDHRIYKPDPQDGYPGTKFNTPASYAAAKAGIISLTRYLATYWAENGIRVNSLSPAGVYTDHDPRFVQRLTNLIPMGRMATKDEYKGAVIFLMSDASAFMTGFNVVMDGGRTAW